MSAETLAPIVLAIFFGGPPLIVGLLILREIVQTRVERRRRERLEARLAYAIRERFCADQAERDRWLNGTWC